MSKETGRSARLAQTSDALEGGALRLYESIIMGVAGTAPAFSIAATTGVLIALVGTTAPGSLLYAGLMIAGIALAYLYLNRLNANSGAAYVWVGQVFHPMLGFFAGWAVLVATVIFMVSATLPGAAATLTLIAPAHAKDPNWQTATAAVWLIVISAIVLKGIRITSFVQVVMTLVELVILIGITAAAIVHFAATPAHAPTVDWFRLSSPSFSAFSSAMLIAIFFFWGWDVTANLNEETRDAGSIPGVAAVASVAVTLMLFVLFMVAVLMGLTDAEIRQAGPNVIFALTEKLLPQPYSQIAILGVLLSTIGTLETNILQFTRTLYSQGRDGTLHPRYARVHHKWKTPWVATLVIAGVGLVLLLASTYIGGVNEAMSASINAVGIDVAYYYGFAGIACAWHYRRTCKESLSKAALLVLWPAAGALLLLAVVISGVAQLDVMAKVFGVGGMVIGVLPWVANVRRRRRASSPHRP